MKQRFGVDRDQRTPVESSRDEKAGVIIDVVIPILQSFVVGLLSAAVLVAFVNLVYDAGELPFWIGSGTIALSSFVWIILVQYDIGITPLDLVAAFLMSLLGGFFCWSFARVATWAKQSWLSMWTLAGFVFLLVFLAHLWLSLIQRLAQPWQFQRKAIWETIKELGVFWGKKQRRQSARPPMVKTGRETIPAEPQEYDEPPQLTDEEMFLELARDYSTLARDDGKTTQGLKGKIKSDGRTLTKKEWERGIEWLVRYSYIEKDNGGYRWKTGASAEIALQQFVM